METGPNFLCADHCAPWDGEGLPPVLATSPDDLVEGYTSDRRIRYGTGAVVPAGRLRADIEARLAGSALAFVDARSARDNCFQARAVRDQEAGIVIR